MGRIAYRKLMSTEQVSTIWPQVVTGLFAITGAISSGLFVWLTSKQTLNERRKTAAEQRKLERLEELYVLFEHWSNDLFSAYLTSVQRHKGILTPKEEHDRMAVLLKESKSDVTRLMMLVDIHMPELKKEFDKVIESRDKNSEFVLSRGKGDLDQFFIHQEEFSKNCEAFKKAMTDFSASRSR